MITQVQMRSNIREDFEMLGQVSEGTDRLIKHIDLVIAGDHCGKVCFSYLQCNGGEECTEFPPRSVTYRVIRASYTIKQ